ncbi:MAG: acyltransferase [Proteobacteria bacterium]|nr:acyltransferase [Pseudomonadota bacterium]MBS0495952.1 acyltransferase [Pseudomonadota bacterium]
MTQEMQDSKNHSIDTLRAAAVLMVFMNHLHSMGIITIPYFGISGGWLGVQIFFVISGYLIIQSAMRYSTLDYLKHRVLRIYPAYLFWFFAFSLILGSLTLDSLDITKK